MALAKRANVTALAITDHDITTGIPEALASGEALGIEVIPGVEVSSFDGKSELHILGYCINWQDPLFNNRLATLRASRHRRNPLIVERLRAAGLDVTYEEVKALAGTESVGRPHIAQLLMKKKYVTSAKEAFDRYLGEGRLAYVAPLPSVCGRFPERDRALARECLAQVGLSHLAARRAELPGTVVFIFQPAEELLSGAKPMIEAGVLDNPRVDEIYGLHLTTQDRAGSVNVRRGPTMASGDGFSIEVTGKGGHGAYPGQFNALAGIAIDKNNRVFTSEQFAGRVQMFRYVTDAEALAEKGQRQRTCELTNSSSEQKACPDSDVCSREYFVEAR